MYCEICTRIGHPCSRHLGEATPAPWVCHAHPVALNGRECRHVNAPGGEQFRGGEVCAGCGCTRGASDDRLKRSLRVKLSAAEFAAAEAGIDQARARDARDYFEARQARAKGKTP